MALKYYLVYSVSVDENAGTPSSRLSLVSDSYGTPSMTGRTLAVYTGSGPNLTAALVDGEYRPNKTAWTETMSGDGGASLDVAVSGAGTPSASIRLTYDGTEMTFDASALTFERSANYPELYSYNKNRAMIEETAAYASSISAAAALGADGARVEGTLDPAAETHTLRWRTAGAPETAGEIRLTGTDAEVFPVLVYGLAPETAYTFEIVSSGPRGTWTSAPVTVTTGAAAALAVPTFEIADTDAAAVKRVSIADEDGAAYFELQIAAGNDFTGAETVRVTNSGGADVYLRRWPESADGAYSIRVRAVSGSAARLDSAWSAPAAVSVDAGGGGPDESAAEMAVYSNLAIHAAPSAPYHAATVSKVSELIAGAVGSTVSDVGGYTGSVTIAQLAAGAARDGVLLLHDGGSAPNANNTPVITASSTDAQIASARAVYYYVQNVRGALAALVADHRHTYLDAPGGGAIAAAPELDEDGTLVPDVALAAPFDPSATYPAGAVAASEGFLYQNTSGAASVGNADFARKWTRVTAAELIARAASGGSAAGRFETEFYGADLDADRSVTVTHNLGVRYVSVELIDLTDGAGAQIVGALVNLTSENALKLTFSDGLAAARRIKAVVRA